MTTIRRAALRSVPSESGVAVHTLLRESAADPIERHPFLVAFADGALPDPVAALRTYARACAGHMQWLPHFLRRAGSRLPATRRGFFELALVRLQGHCDEQQGHELRRIGIRPESVAGMTAAQLFARFAAALGVGAPEADEPFPAEVRWREGLLGHLASATPGAVVGTMGLGAMHGAAAVDRRILRSILNLGVLRRDQFVFFELRCLPDDRLAAELHALVAALAAEPEGLDELHAGLQLARELRGEFLDAIYLEVGGDARRASSARRVATSRSRLSILASTGP